MKVFHAKAFQSFFFHKNFITFLHNKSTMLIVMLRFGIFLNFSSSRKKFSEQKNDFHSYNVFIRTQLKHFCADLKTSINIKIIVIPHIFEISQSLGIRSISFSPRFQVAGYSVFCASINLIFNFTRVTFYNLHFSPLLSARKRYISIKIKMMNSCWKAEMKISRRSGK